MRVNLEEKEREWTNTGEMYVPYAQCLTVCMDKERITAENVYAIANSGRL